MSQPIIILGAGGHAKVLLDALRLQGKTVLGLTDADGTKHGSSVLDAPVLGDDTVLKSHEPQKVLLVNGVGSIKNTTFRQQLFEKYKALGYSFASVIHPSAVIARDVICGEGAQIMAGTVIQPGGRIGDNVIINTNATLDHDCRIGNHVHIASGACLSGGVIVEEGVHIGAAATLIQLVRIGAFSTVGAASLVLKEVPAKTIVAGVPAKGLSS
jgi:sugar O-acyltransferase (sialic acid O-acetyltransferase NeuD family)